MSGRKTLRLFVPSYWPGKHIAVRTSESLSALRIFLARCERRVSSHVWLRVRVTVRAIMVELGLRLYLRPTRKQLQGSVFPRPPNRSTVAILANSLTLGRSVWTPFYKLYKLQRSSWGCGWLQSRFNGYRKLKEGEHRRSYCDICVYHLGLCVFFPGAFRSSRVTGACPVTTDLIILII